MPATTIHRVVRNTSVAAGGLYYFERSGELLRPLPNAGLKLKPDATNGVWIYRVASASGVPLTMVGPATLGVYYKDPDAPTAQTLISEYTAATFDATDKCFKFDLSATDFSTYNGKDLEYRFRDSSVASVTASVESVLLYERRIGDMPDKVGTWKIIYALVEGLSTKAVRFESSDPSVCRVERGLIASSYLQIAGEQAQTDQYCVLIGVGEGSCEIRCIAEGDENKQDTVTVEVRVHPDDAPAPTASSGLAAELNGMLDNVRIPIALLPPKIAAGGRRYWLGAGGTHVFFERRFIIPGSADDSFDIDLNFSGTVPKTNVRWMSTTGMTIGLFLVVGLTNGRALGGESFRFPAIAHDQTTAETELSLDMLADLGLSSATHVNNLVTPRATGDRTEVLDEDISFVAQGGDEICVAWVMSGSSGADYILGHTYFQDLPTGLFHSLMTVNSITHHAPNEAP